LRDDANLNYLTPKTEQKKRGRPKLYSGKVDVKNIDKDQFAEECRSSLVPVLIGQVFLF